MSYIFLQMLLCILLAGLIGAVIGWLLRGDCKTKLKEREKELMTEINLLKHDKNYQQEMQNTDIEIQKALGKESEDLSLKGSDIDLDEEIIPKTKLASIATTVLAGGAIATNLEKDNEDEIENKIDEEIYVEENIENLSPSEKITYLLNKRKINLSQRRINIYKENDIDFENDADIEDSYDIEKLDGINTKYANKFRKMGIHTTKELVQNLDRNYKEIDKAAKKLKVDSEDISRWISMADILTLPGVNNKDSKLLHAIGITSARELGVVNIYSLYSELVAYNEKNKIVSHVPSIDDLQLLSKIAKQLG